MLFYFLGGFLSQPRVSQSTFAQIERLVGRLPPWMKGNNKAPAAQLVSRQPPLQQHHAGFYGNTQQLNIQITLDANGDNQMESVLLTLNERFSR